MRRTPLEEQLTGRDVNLLENTVVKPAQLGTTNGRQVGRNGIIYGDEGSVVRGNDEIMQVAFQSDGGNDVLGRVSRIQLLAKNDVSIPQMRSR